MQSMQDRLLRRCLAVAAPGASACCASCWRRSRRPWGVWQHQRAGLKDRLQQQAADQLAQPPLRLRPGAAASYDELVWRRATAQGTWDRANEILIDNRIHARQPGFHVITPFQIGDRWLLVNRGWYPAPPVRGDRVIPPPAHGTEVAGVLAPDAADAFELAADDPAARIWQNLKIATWRARAPRREFYPVVLLEEAPTPGMVPVELRAGLPRRRQPGLPPAVVRAGARPAARLDPFHVARPAPPPELLMRRRRLELLLIIAIAAGTPIAATLLYVFAPPGGTTNHGELLAPVELDAVLLPAEAPDWQLLVVGEAACGEACQARLCAIAQARLVNVGELERVGRLWLLSGPGTPPAELPVRPGCGRQLPAEVPATVADIDVRAGVAVRRASAAQLAVLPAAAAPLEAADYIYVLDPLRRVIMRYPPDAAVKDIASDLRRLLRLSQRAG